MLGSQSEGAEGREAKAKKKNVYLHICMKITDVLLSRPSKESILKTVLISYLILVQRDK